MSKNLSKLVREVNMLVRGFVAQAQIPTQKPQRDDLDDAARAAVRNVISSHKAQALEKWNNLVNDYLDKIWDSGNERGYEQAKNALLATREITSDIKGIKTGSKYVVSIGNLQTDPPTPAARAVVAQMQPFWKGVAGKAGEAATRLASHGKSFGMGTERILLLQV